MSSHESLAVEVKDNVAQVTLLGPGKGNAMGPAFWAEMPVLFAELDADPEVRAIVLNGSGNNFCYGLDLLAMGSTLPSVDGGSESGGVASARPRAKFHTDLKRLQDSITAVADCRTPTIAAIHGWCIGGGVDLISAVDIRYASADAKFSVREVKLAIVADVGSLARLPYILSDGHLRELALTGKDIDAARAEKIGLVNEVLPDADAALAAAHATAAEIAANSPLTVRGIKDVLDEQRTDDVAASLRYVAAWNSAFLPSRDLKEAVAAMFEKRAPNFTGD
jgi:enoyl-CoA hydratase